MKRVGIALALLALCLAILVGLLVRRALESAAFEKRVQHQAVANRSFDEMERALSRFLAREEARPFGDYRFYLEGSDPGGGGSLRRSPLSRAPEYPFVLGYFQIDPDGSLSTPRLPRDPELAHGRGDWKFEPEVARLETTLRRAWQRALRTRPEAADRAAALEEAPPKAAFEPPAEARPGASRDLELTQRTVSDEDREQSAFDVLRKLNRAQGLRAERKQKVVEEPLSQVYAQTPPQASADYTSATRDRDTDSPPLPRSPSARPARIPAGRAAAEREARADVGDGAARWASPDNASQSEGRRTREVPSPMRASMSAERKEEEKKPDAKRQGKDTGDHALAGGPEATVRVTLDPMVGRPGGESELLLYRTVLVGEQGYRQGLLLDWHRLGSWLQEQVLEPSGLTELARISFFGPDQSSGAPASPEGASEIDTEESNPDSGGYVFLHRFAEPFDALGVRLVLTPLAGVGSTTPIYLLVGLLAVVAAAGLLAVYRMVAVVVHFAERRSNFVSAVSHELKTPLTSIRMYGEMLRDGLVPSQAKRDDYYRTITHESERLSRLIDNVLEFSRLEKGNRELHLVRASLPGLLEQAAEHLRPHAEHQGFRLQLELDQRLPPVRFDRDAVTQVLFNLVDNAIKYARDAEPKEVHIECRQRGDRVRLSVRDYGPGVPRRHVSKVFEAFYRGEDELTRTTKGTGIGLALVKDLVEAMGATIQAANLDASQGGGFAVNVEFPVNGS